MRHIELTAVECHQLGEVGLSVKGQRRFCSGVFAATDGRTIAHDIVEHQQGPKSIGSIGDELIALGGVCVSRAQWGDMSRNRMSVYPPEEHLSTDIIELGRLHLEDDIPLRQKLIRSRFTPLESLIDDAIELSRETIRKNFADPHSVSQSRIDTYLEQCRTLMNRGVTLAHRRFGQGTSMNTQFWNINNAMEPFFNHEPQVGDKFRLSYGNGNACCEQIYGDY